MPTERLEGIRKRDASSREQWRKARSPAERDRTWCLQRIKQMEQALNFLEKMSQPERCWCDGWESRHSENPDYRTTGCNRTRAAIAALHAPEEP